MIRHPHALPGQLARRKRETAKNGIHRDVPERRHVLPVRQIGRNNRSHRYGLIGIEPRPAVRPNGETLILSVETVLVLVQTPAGESAQGRSFLGDVGRLAFPAPV